MATTDKTGEQGRAAVTAAAGKRRRTRLAASEKYEVYTSVLTGSATQQELADKYRIDRSTIRRICETAREGALEALARRVPGRPGQTAEGAELEAARDRIKELEKTVCEQAMRLHLDEGKGGRG